MASSSRCLVVLFVGVSIAAVGFSQLPPLRACSRRWLKPCLRALPGPVHHRSASSTMAQPIAPEAFGEEAAAKWLQAAISPEGCLADVFSRAVKAAVQADLDSQTGAIPLAVTAAIEPYKQAAENQDTVIEGLQSRLAAAETRLQAYQKLEDDLDTAFSWRKCERDTDSQEWLAAWRRLFVDKDWLANVADQMHDPAMANAVAVCVANPQNPEAAKLKQAISMRNAPKTSLKELCLSTHGGGPDRFRAFMSDKAASTDDKVMAAVAKKALGFFCWRTYTR